MGSGSVVRLSFLDFSPRVTHAVRLLHGDDAGLWKRAAEQLNTAMCMGPEYHEAQQLGSNHAFQA